MPVTLNPYLGFKGTAREAMEFYKSVFGGELLLSTFGDMNAAHDPADNDLVMHGQLDGANGITLMGSDHPDGMGEYVAGTNFSVSLSGDDEATLRGYWDKLSDGASVTAPLDTAPWGDIFGMCTDRFGVQWLVNITTSQ